MGLDQDTIRKLLADDDANTKSKVVVPYRDPGPIKEKRGPWRRVASSRRCLQKTGKVYCHAETWMTFDGVPYCWLHGLEVMNDMVVTLTDRLEKQYKTKGDVTVVGEL